MKPGAALLCLLLLVLCPAALSARAGGKKDILFVNSYHNGYAWSDDILAGVREGLAESGADVNLQIEYLDAKKHDLESLSKAYLELFRGKFARHRFNAVIAADNDAFNYVMSVRDELFPGAPVVFCGVNEQERLPQAMHNVTGVVENIDVEESLRIAMRLHPGRDKVLVLGDRSTTGMAIRAQVEQAVPALRDRLAFTFVSENNLAHLMELARTARGDTLIYFIPMYQDVSGESFSTPEILAQMSAQAGAPIYSNWEFLLGHGIVGGHLLRGEDHGRLAARLALRVLQGESPDALGIDKKVYGRFMFDHDQLERFKIRREDLPEGSIVINEPPTFYELNKQVFWILIVSFLALSMVLVSLVNNIKRRKVIERRIKDQVAFLQLLIDTIPLPIYYKGGEGQYHGWNAAFERWFGLTRGEAREGGAVGAALVQLDEGAGPRELRPGQVRSEERRLLSADGTPHDVVLHQAAYFDATGAEGGLVGVIYDISALRRAEEDLRAAEEKYRGIFENSPLGIFRAGPDGRYLEVNQALAAMLGCESLEEARASDLNLLAVLRADPDREAALLAAPESGGVVRFETRFKRKDGRSITVTVNIRPVLDEDGLLRHFEGMVEDVTFKANLERQLRQSQKMEAIGTLAGGIAHDFNNILTSILNSTELALLDLPVGVPARADLERVVRAAHRGSALVKQILTFSRPSQEGFQATDVAAVVRDAVGLLRASMPRNIVVVEQLEARRAHSFADPIQIQQIVMNCVTNAFQALRDIGGRIEIALVEEVLGEERARTLNVQPGSYLRLSIADNGPGIPLEIRDLIFDPFFTTKDKAEGTGLGLAVAHGIVKVHKGAIRVTSAPFERTAFDIYLPCIGQAADDGLAPREAFPGRGERILFVEDDEDQLETIPRVLARLGYEVTARHDAAGALAALAEAPDGFDCMVTDYDMPEVNGVDLAEEVGRRAPGMPVILVSGRKRAADALGGAGNIKKLLLKPYDGGHISRAIREALAESGRGVAP
ncbi:PAS domain S-box protein [Desulfovibrio aminophilus]|nr:PAS domain S-box protein [Desulfovibrio aminophilus]MCM0754832.1 PAS domain S-box protein [Desulfovibrio aminophilus]